MVDCQYSEEDKKIVFLVKTMKKKYLEDTLQKGNLCFNVPGEFNSFDNGLAVGQQDEWDSHLNFDAKYILYAPIISEDDSKIHYGTPIKIADSAPIHKISGISKCTPLCSFRKVEKTDLVEKYGAIFFRLDNIVDRIRTELGHDAFIFISSPYELVKRISNKIPYFARSIHYGEIDSDFQKFLDAHNFEQKEMFQKRIDYAWQKEFRVIIEPTEETDRKIISIGSIEDIAFGGDLEMLREGVVFAETSEQIQAAKKRAKEEGGVYDQLRFPPF